MFVSRTAAAVLGAGLLCVTAHASAADPPQSELDQVKRELAALRQTYDARIQALEQRIAELQARGAAAPAPEPLAAAPASAAAPAATGGGIGAAGAFNPAVSLVLAGTYANLAHDPERYRLQGFVPTGGEVGPGRRGFSIDESELGLSASIDPLFSGQLTASFGADDSVSIEEAWFQSSGLVEGTQLRVGRFLSAIGYLNEHHAHTWDFVDAPLVYQAFFGGPLRDDGLQVRWVAPADRFVELGAEIGSASSLPASGGGRNGLGSAALFAHLGDDIGASASYRLGVSLLGTRPDLHRFEDVDAAGSAISDSFDGGARTVGLDGIYKWSPGGNATRQSLIVQGEYFRRRQSGRLGHDSFGPAPLDADYRATQSGWYLQTAYQFMPRWRVGARYDRLDAGAAQIAGSGLSAADFPLLQSAKPSRATVMLDFSPSEFSRFRIQLGADRSNPAATDRQLYLQYIMSLGAHGAHTF